MPSRWGLFAVTIHLFNGRLLVIRDVSTAAAVDLALQLCSALAVVLMLGVARVALEIEWRSARFDELTGALNRKAFFEAMEAEIGHQGMVALIFADLDGLKGLNDRLGHEAGDQALLEFAGYVRGAIRKDDLFARIGGDEFVVFMRVRDVAAAERVATRLNRVINVDMQGGVRALKCSLGTLILPQGTRSIDMELRQADALMYMAKKAQTGVMMAVSDESCTGAPVPPIHAGPSPVSQTIVRSSKQRHVIPSAVAGPRVNPSIA